MYSGENAFHITVDHFYMIDFTNVLEIQSILGFESDILMKEVDNPRRYYLSSSCNQVVVTDGKDSHVLTMPTGYFTFSKFIEAVGVAMVKVLPLISMTIEDDHVRFNDQSNESWYFDRTSVDTTIDGFGWTPWFKLSPSTRNLCIEHPVENVFDPSGLSLPDTTNDQGLGGHAYIDPNTYIEYDWIEHPVETVFDPSGPSLPDATNDQGIGGHAYIDPNTYIEYDWQLCTSDYRFLLKPLATYTMTNS